ncbi:P1 family peptidase, partial [Faecalibaculum rodentium]|uniref:P1 family peptidase n=1 Tax=Faecalibaculum rodentium TaxID=1702221 RepID=UPI00263A2434
MKSIPITDISGFQIGYADNAALGTGCTAILCRAGAVAGCDVRGGGPATRDTDFL